MINNKEHYSKQISQSFFNEFNQQEQSEQKRREKCDAQTKYYAKIGYLGSGLSGVMLIGKNNEVYEWMSYDCKLYHKGYLGERTTNYYGKEPCDLNGISGLGGCYQYKLEGNRLCTYRRINSARIEKSCYYEKN